MALILGSIKDAPDAQIELKDPATGAPTGAFITLVGPENPKRKSLEHARQRKVRDSIARTQRLPVTDPADDEQDAIDRLVSLTIGWSGITDESGQEIPFTPDAARKVYEDDDNGWIRIQLLTALEDRRLFIKRSAKT